MKVVLPECIVECLVRMYRAPAATALRRFILDVFLETLELRDFDEERYKCARSLQATLW